LKGDGTPRLKKRGGALGKKRNANRKFRRRVEEQ